MTMGVTSYGLHNMGALALEETPNMGALEDIGVFAMNADTLLTRPLMEGTLATPPAFSGVLVTTPVFTARLGVLDVST